MDAKNAVQGGVVVVRTIYHVQRCVVAWVTVATTDINPVEHLVAEKDEDGRL